MARDRVLFFSHSFVWVFVILVCYKRALCVLLYFAHVFMNKCMNECVNVSRIFCCSSTYCVDVKARSESCHVVSHCIWFETIPSLPCYVPIHKSLNSCVIMSLLSLSLMWLKPFRLQVKWKKVENVFTARCFVECGYAMVSRPSVCLSETLVYPGRIFLNFFWKYNYPKIFHLRYVVAKKHRG